MITNGRQTGRLVVIAGPMFAGKSTELLRRVNRARRARIPTVIAKPSPGHSGEVVRSHDGVEAEARLIIDSHGAYDDIIPHVEATGARLIAIDEAQFLRPWHVHEIRHLLERGVDVICAGLDLDYAGIPFGPMPMLMAMADEVLKLSAVCVVCGREATRTQRLDHGKPAGPGPLILSGSEHYEPRCADCWVDPYQVREGPSDAG